MQRFRKSVFPAIATVLGVGVQWVGTGKFDKAELATAVTGLSASFIAFVFKNDPA